MTFITGTKKGLLVGILFCLVVAQSAWADTFQLDPRYTMITFRIKHIMGYAIGSFPKSEGTITLNDDNTALTKVEGVIDVTAIDTRLKERDDDLRSAKFFDAEKFPQATFVTTKIGKDELTGDLTLKGVTKPVKFKYVFGGTALDQYGNRKTAVSLKGSINRKDFNMDYNMKTADGTNLLGDEVDFMIELHGIIKK